MNPIKTSTPTIININITVGVLPGELGIVPEGALPGELTDPEQA